MDLADNEIAMVLMYQAFDMDWVCVGDEISVEMELLAGEIKNAGDSLRYVLDRICTPHLNDARSFWKSKETE